MQIKFAIIVNFEVIKTQDGILKLSQETIDRIKSQIDIVDVLSDFLTIKKVGQNYRALSPFTNEKTPSFYISPSKGIFKDFSSGKGGDAIAFIMELEGLSYIEALKYLAKKYGIEIIEEELTDEELAQQNERESLYIVLNFACEYFKNTLWNTNEGKAIGLSYFKERGFNDKIIRDFELGYSIDEWDGLLKTAKEKGFNPDILEKAGLIIRKDEKEYDRFRGRVIFPIHNITGKPIAFGARILTSDKKQPKYINSPETEIYHKSNVLYGIFQAKQGIRNEDNCYLVEGYTDVISLHLAGVENVVASSGTSLTDQQIKMIGRYTQNVTVLFDGDTAGIKASLRGIDMILESGMNVKAVVFPDGEDPDSYSRKIGSVKFQEYLSANVQDFIKFKIGLFHEEAANDPIKKADTVREIVESVAKVPDPIRRTVYIQESSKLLDIDESILIAEQNKILIRKHREAKRKEDREKPDVSSALEQMTGIENLEFEQNTTHFVSWQEKESIRLLLTYGVKEVEKEVRICDYMLTELEDIEFNTKVYADILSIYKSKLKEGQVVDAAYFIKHGTEEIQKEVIDLTTEKYDISSNWHDMYKINVPKESEIVDNVVFTNIHRLKLRVIQKMIDKSLEDLKITESAEKQEELMKIIETYKKMEMEIAKILGNVVAR